MDEKGGSVLKERDIEEIFSVKTCIRESKRERNQSGHQRTRTSAAAELLSHYTPPHTFPLFWLLSFIHPFESSPKNSKRSSTYPKSLSTRATRFVTLQSHARRPPQSPS